MTTAAENKKNRERIRAVLHAMRSGPCVDCDVTYPHYVMEFDHRDPSTKLNTVAALAGQSLVRVMKEIEKCDLVCANCHKIRTHTRRSI